MILIIASLLQKNIPFAIIETVKKHYDSEGFINLSENEYYLVVHNMHRKELLNRGFRKNDIYDDIIGKTLLKHDIDYFKNNPDLFVKKHGFSSGNVYEYAKYSFKSFYDRQKLYNSQISNINEQD